MVCYCCVKGCKNNSINARKDSCGVSFHAFPSNTELKIKWLKAIGRPGWNPPNHVRICSVHFSGDQLNQDGYRTRIKEDACPVKSLPLNSNFEARSIEVCRICLATDTQMYSLNKDPLKTQFETIMGHNEKNNIEGLPDFICYICKASLKKCYNLIERSMICQAILLDIFAENGQITKSLVKKQNRRKLNLAISLCSYSVTPGKTFDIVSDESVSHLTETEANNLDKKESNITEHCKDLKWNLYTNQTIDKKYKREEIFETNTENKNIHFINSNMKTIYFDQIGKTDVVDENSDSDGIDDLQSHSPDSMTLSMNTDYYDTKDNLKISYDVNQINGIKLKNLNGKRKKISGYTPDEISMQKYFQIVKLTELEQIEEWKRSTEKYNLNKALVYKCEVCSKSYASENTLKNHLLCHSPARGLSECLVCKQRFKNLILMRSHANRLHGTKYYCKSCPKTFSNVSVAKKHHRWHAGHLYRCEQCPFASAHSSALGVHSRSQHSRLHACARCGHNFVSSKGLKLHCATAHRREENIGTPSDAHRCDECDIGFYSEGARRVHILTSKQHKLKTENTLPLDPSLKTTCKWCGAVFPTLGELTAHARVTHRRPVRKTTWRMPGDCYPTQCDHCPTLVTSRQEHWRHVRREHPRQRASYRPVITAVCHVCGKGFQNATKLRAHSTRHAAGAQPPSKRASVRGGQLGEHVRPHVCALCSRAFSLKTNLVRHARVHSTATPYECHICSKKFKYSTSVGLHVRTVHHRLPHPSRARKHKMADHAENK